MLLLELREIIDRHGNYGQWVDTRTGKAHAIHDSHGHLNFLETNGPELFDVNDDDAEPLAAISLYKSAFENGFVRVTHHPESDVNFQGLPKSLKRAHLIIRSTVAQPDVGRVHIEAVDPHMQPIKDQAFNMLSNTPADVMEFIKTL